MFEARQAYWEKVYATRAPTEVGWFQDEPAPSLAMIAAAGIEPTASVIDVGGGASRLVDRLLDEAFQRVTVLDVSIQGLTAAKTRLGARAAAVDWLVEDVTTWSPPRGAFDLWHDRAVFHFLIEETERRAYVRALSRGLRSGGHAVLAPFALTGPERCSGLPVRRYSPETLLAELGADFQLIDAKPETHLTPDGASQDFIWCLFRKCADRP